MTEGCEKVVLDRIDPTKNDQANLFGAFKCMLTLIFGKLDEWEPIERRWSAQHRSYRTGWGLFAAFAGPGSIYPRANLCHNLLHGKVVEKVCRNGQIGAGIPSLVRRACTGDDEVAWLLDHDREGYSILHEELWIDKRIPMMQEADVGTLG